MSGFSQVLTKMKRLVSFLVAEIFVFTSLSFAWAHPADSLRPRVTAQGQLRQELEQAADGGRYSVRQARREIRSVLEGDEVLSSAHSLAQAEEMVRLALTAPTARTAVEFLTALNVDPFHQKAQQWVAKALLRNRTPWRRLIHRIETKRKTSPHFYIVGGPLTTRKLKELLKATGSYELAFEFHRIAGYRIWTVSLGTSDRTDPYGLASVNHDGYFVLANWVRLDMHSHPVGDDVTLSEEHDRDIALNFAEQSIPFVVVALSKDRKSLRTSIYKQWKPDAWWAQSFLDEPEAIRQLMRLPDRPFQRTLAASPVRNGVSNGARDGGIATPFLHSLDADRAPQLLPAFP